MRPYAIFAGGLVVGLLAALFLPHYAAPAQAQPAPAAADASAEIAALRADVETLKAKATDQSHVMTDVHQFSCLWFAGRAKSLVCRMNGPPSGPPMGVE